MKGFVSLLLRASSLQTHHFKLQLQFRLALVWPLRVLSSPQMQISSCQASSLPLMTHHLPLSMPAFILMPFGKSGDYSLLITCSFIAYNPLTFVLALLCAAYCGFAACYLVKVTAPKPNYSSGYDADRLECIQNEVDLTVALSAGQGSSPRICGPCDREP